MKPTLRKIFTHLVLLLAGGVTAAMLTRSPAETDGRGYEAGEKGTGRETAGEGRSVSAPGEAKKRGGESSGFSARDFRNAWDAIAKRDVSRFERCQLQIALLKQWAKTDLEGAMLAALESPWDGNFEEGGINSLVPAFREAFARNPMQAWDLIQSGKLGPGSALFRWEWVNSVATEHPLLVLSCFGEFSEGLQRAALNPLVHKHGKDREVLAAIGKMLAQMAPGDHASSLSAQFYNFAPPAESPDALREIIAGAGDGQMKTMSIHALAAKLRNQGIETIRSQWQQLSPEDRVLLNRALLTSVNGGMGNPTALLDLAIQSGDWELFQDPKIAGVNGVMARYAKTAEAISLAEWGLGLPDRPEVHEVFRRSVSAYIDGNHADAKEWILSIPEGDWRRDRSLAEYSQNSLWAKSDPEASQWAIDRIQDPKIKGTVVNWRKEWAQTRGGP